MFICLLTAQPALSLHDSLYTCLYTPAPVMGPWVCRCAGQQPSALQTWASLARPACDPSNAWTDTLTAVAEDVQAAGAATRKRYRDDEYTSGPDSTASEHEDSDKLLPGTSRSTAPEDRRLVRPPAADRCALSLCLPGSAHTAVLPVCLARALSCRDA